MWSAPLRMLLLLGLSACAAPTWSETVRGDETLVTAQPTQASDPASARRAHEHALARAEALRIERVLEAPKRTALDPIIVALIETSLAEADGEGELFEALLPHFTDHPVITLLPRNRVEEAIKIAEWSGNAPRIPADVVIHTRSCHKQALALSPDTQEFGTMRTLVLEARIVSSFLPGQRTIEKQGDAGRESELIEAFASAIKQVVVAEIGPTIPADADHLRHPDNRTELDSLRGWLTSNGGAR